MNNTLHALDISCVFHTPNMQITEIKNVAELFISSSDTALVYATDFKRIRSFSAIKLCPLGLLFTEQQFYCETLKITFSFAQNEQILLYWCFVLMYISIEILEEKTFGECKTNCLSMFLLFVCHRDITGIPGIN